MHDWDVAPDDAVRIQRELASEVRIAPFKEEVQIIAGADVSLNMFAKDIYAGIVLLDARTLAPVGYSAVRSRTDFPYIPGLLSFREAPALLECFERLPEKPDVMLVDGQGIAHPRRLGIAAHLGVLTGLPTIGVAKSRLYGAYTEPQVVGQAEELIDPKTGDLLGYAYKSKKNANPLLISPGYLTDPETALEIVKSAIRGYRLPEPTRLAHKLVNDFRTGASLQEYGQSHVSSSVIH